jgi:uncharacterized RDD family membrane protein YckC
VGRRLLCVLYDGLLLAAVLLVATFPFVALTRNLDPALVRHLLQAYVFLVAGIYFTVFWRKGQTLAMKTWKLRLESEGGSQPGWGRLWLRYGLAWANLALLGLGWWAALFRADRQFLQDRLAGTRLVDCR